jgi:hypothetical protein
MPAQGNALGGGSPPESKALKVAKQGQAAHVAIPFEELDPSDLQHEGSRTLPSGTSMQRPVT